MRKLIPFCLFFFCIAGLQAAINIKRIDPGFLVVRYEKQRIANHGIRR